MYVVIFMFVNFHKLAAVSTVRPAPKDIKTIAKSLGFFCWSVGCFSLLLLLLLLLLFCFGFSFLFFVLFHFFFLCISLKHLFFVRTLAAKPLARTTQPVSLVLQTRDIAAYALLDLLDLTVNMVSNGFHILRRI